MDAQSEERTQVYPGGVDAPAYRLALRVWLVFFLLLICIGLANYVIFRL